VFKSIYSLVGVTPRLVRYSVNAVTEGSDALAGVAVRIEHDGVSAVGRANDADVVKASALAMVNALNRMEKAKEER
jgi:2-isopropylmalate synthase